MKIVAFSGSLNNESTTAKGIRVAAEAARRAGVEVVEFSLREHPLPVYDPSDENNYTYENVQYWVKLMSEADGYLLGSPEYHNGPSGAFKNALDFVGGRQFGGKPVGLVAASGGPVATNTLNQMMTILRSLHAYVVPQFGGIPGGTEFTAEGNFKDAAMQERFEQVGYSVARMVKLFHGEKAGN